VRPMASARRTNAKELVEIERDDLGTIVKKTGESRPEFVSSGGRCLSLRQETSRYRCQPRLVIG
jgi:hypothetical protein